MMRALAGQSVSALALGAANFGGIGSARRLIGQGESEAEAHALLDCALSLGITLIDTAGSYADGASEAMIGRWLRTRSEDERAQVKISSKVGLRGGLKPATIERELQLSRARLGVEALDFYLAHIPDPNVAWSQVMDTMGQLQAEGLIGAFGVSNVGADDVAACASAGHRPALVQNRFNLLDRVDAENGMMATCRDNGLAYTCYSPLAGGLLGGAYAYAEKIPEGRRLALRADLYAHLWKPGLDERIAGLQALAAAHGTSLPALAVWWLLNHPSVTIVMLGARTPRQLEQLVRGALDLPFDAGLFAAVGAAARSAE
ncbi:aldo/keto reductase [Rhizorhabdus sp. FW153]|uniref:aldo/keto reductase n=1 Tax=Rhizorhabdus sp. FW153 TaxID=3400216 RepID=UPI003CF53A8D